VSARTVVLIGVDGSRLVVMCSDPVWQMRPDAQLWGVAPTAITSRRVATIPGERVEVVHTQPRTFRLPVQVTGATELAIDQALGRLGEILAGGDVRVVYERPDGQQREITARHLAGGDVVEAVGRSGHLQRHVVVPLVLRAFWPYWRDPQAPIRREGPTQFLDGRSVLSNVVTVTNNGDVETWPEVKLTGYAENVEMLSMTTGQVWRITEVLQAGDTLRVDTDPRNFGVYLNEALAYSIGGNPIVDPISEWWPLAPGVNHLLFRANTATGTETLGTFELRWREQWETV